MGAALLSFCRIQIALASSVKAVATRSCRAVSNPSAGHRRDVSRRRDGHAARRFFQRALTTLKVRPAEVVTDKAPVYARVLANWSGGLAPRRAIREQPDGGRPRPTQTPAATERGLRTDQTARVIIAGIAFMQNLMGT
jgi:hypothetical protein